MRIYLLIFILLGINLIGAAQNTVTSGNWSDPSVWSGGAVPAATGTVNVSNPLTINQNITITTGTYNFGYNGTSAVAVNVTDPPGGTAYTLTSVTTGGSLTIWAGTTTFGGAASIDNSTLWVKAGATLIIGPLDINNGSTIIVDGTLIVNGNFTNSNNGTGTMTVSGSVQVFGNYTAGVGNVSLAGSGTINTTGTITTTGSSSVFGSTNNCTQGPCSGTTLTCTFDNYITPSTATVCPGVSTVTFTSNPVTSNAPTSPSYQWQSSTDNISFSNVGTNSATYATPTLSQTTYVKVTITATGPACFSTSSTSKVTVLSSGGWLGTTNSWNTASNWCSGAVPTSTTDVVITNGTGINNMPLIAAGVAAVCRDLIISNTSPATSVTLAASATTSLSIFGNFTNDGTFTDNTTAAAAGVKLVGTTAQSIAGITANVFNNLTIANTSGLTPAINITTNNVTVNNNLTMTSGISNLNGFTITLGTSAGSTGTLAYTAGSFYNGNIERWFPTAAVAIGNVAGHFPIGTSTDYRPLFLGNAGLSAGGTIKVRHTTPVAGPSTAVSFADGASTVAVRSNSFWTVSTANGLGTGTHSLRIEGTGFGTVGAVADLRETLVGSVVGTAGVNAGTVTNPQVNRTGFTSANLSNTNFYWGSVNSTNSPLPVSLVSFTGHQVSDQIDLNWKTASELNFSFFSLEKSIDGKEFSEISKITGHGTTQEAHQYVSIDKDPLIGKNYYRLKSVDFDGASEYFDVIEVNFSKEKQFSVFPNPTDGESITARINFHADEQSTIVVFDNLGIIVGRYDFNQPEATLKFPLTLSSGVYYTKFSSPGFSKVIRFVVK
jgi:hypothetical protein